jgi:hypothetical protein
MLRMKGIRSVFINSTQGAELIESAQNEYSIQMIVGCDTDGVEE